MPSPPFFITVFDPLNSIIRHYGRGCRISPTGSDAFADDSTLQTDGPDAMPAMAVMVAPVVTVGYASASGWFRHWWTQWPQCELDRLWGLPRGLRHSEQMGP